MVALNTTTILATLDRLGLDSAALAAPARNDHSPRRTDLERSFWPDQIGWAAALFHGGDRDRAERVLMALVDSDGILPDTFYTVAPAVLTHRHAAELVTAAIQRRHVLRTYDRYPERPGVAVFAPLAAGVGDLEDALLAALIAPTTETPYDYRTRHPNRMLAALGAFAAVRADPARAEGTVFDPLALLDHWAHILGPDQRTRLAGATALLAPLGLAEADRRCGTVGEVEGVPLAAAFAGLGNVDDALALAARLDPRHRQSALVGIASATLDDRQARALVAAHRKCPKVSRGRDDQMYYMHRFGQLLLALDRPDDAVSTLSTMRDCRYSGIGPAYLARDILTWWEQRPERATMQALRTVLDVLASKHVIPQELSPVAADAVRIAYVLADEPLRDEIVRVRAPRLRLPLSHYWGSETVDAGLAEALAATGQPEAADEIFVAWADADATAVTKYGVGRAMLTAACRAGLPVQRPDVFAGLVTRVFGGTGRPISDAIADLLVGALDRAGRRIVTDHLDEWPAENVAPLIRALATAAANAIDGRSAIDGRTAAGVGDAVGDADLDLLMDLVDAAAGAWTTVVVCRRIALALARGGDLTRAVTLAGRTGLLVD